MSLRALRDTDRLRLQRAAQRATSPPQAVDALRAMVDEYGYSVALRAAQEVEGVGWHTAQGRR
jgi:hypothetical protein